jgi:hypothetical protein
MHSSIPDFLSRLLAELNVDNDLTLGESLRKFAFDDCLVQAARGELQKYNRTKRQIAAFNGIFNRGFYLWPFNLTVSKLDDLFRPPTLQDEEWPKERWVKTYGPLSPRIEAAFKHVEGSFAEMSKLFRSGRIGVTDEDNNVVTAAALLRRDNTINLETSDLYEMTMELWRRENLNNGLLRCGLRLSLPLAPVGAPITSSPAAASLEAHLNNRHDQSKHDGTKSKASAVERCTTWLISEMNKSPKHRPKAKNEYLKDAETHFQGLSKRGFEKAWADAISATSANWSAPGRPRSVR